MAKLGLGEDCIPTTPTPVAANDMNVALFDKRTRDQLRQLPLRVIMTQEGRNAMALNPEQPLSDNMLNMERLEELIARKTTFPGKCAKFDFEGNIVEDEIDLCAAFNATRVKRFQFLPLYLGQSNAGSSNAETTTMSKSVKFVGTQARDSSMGRHTQIDDEQISGGHIGTCPNPDTERFKSQEKASGVFERGRRGTKFTHQRQKKENECHQEPERRGHWDIG
ncbi:uncharacterized protein EI97DRAFT_456325 [Westerdykella ornata]|uniref:Uncharacterized protein n=1 Tax=Westerdykella ornata TaxID=318751 RepID=A0A6A6JQR6_WESOR|nr:uncharacterized protein EI97DRAFT_456325 [Westerdykella ornata]KAF2278892.1 hypothetical protein EI97DRAFT_456325 [Westerdykella ornata]